MDIFDERRAELERHEFMMGTERGRLAVALDLLTDSLIMVGQHGVYCASTRNPSMWYCSSQKSAFDRRKLRTSLRA